MEVEHVLEMVGLNHMNFLDPVAKELACMGCDHNKGDPNSLFPVLGNRDNKYVLSGFIDWVLGRNGRAREVTNQHWL